MAEEVEITPETMQKIDSGELHLHELLDLSENDLKFIAATGFELYEQGRGDEARSIFEGLEAVHSEFYYGPAGLGAMALNEEDLDEAEAHLKRAVELGGEDPSVRANLGETYLRKGKFDEAAAEFEKALSLDPEGEDPGANRARAILQGIDRLLAESEEIQSQIKSQQQ